MSLVWFSPPLLGWLADWWWWRRCYAAAVEVVLHDTLQFRSFRSDEWLPQKWETVKQKALQWVHFGLKHKKRGNWNCCDLRADGWCFCWLFDDGLSDGLAVMRLSGWWNWIIRMDRFSGIIFNLTNEDCFWEYVFIFFWNFWGWLKGF